MKYNAIRFINKHELKVLETEGRVTPIDQLKLWSKRKVLYAFVINNYYTENHYIPVAKMLNEYHDAEYSHIVYLNFEGYMPVSFAPYDIMMFHDYSKKELNLLKAFDIDEDAYDSGPVYIVPEYRLSHYDKSHVVDIKPVREVVQKLNENIDKEAINKMPEKINLGIQEESQDQTFMKLYMELVEAEKIDKEAFLQAIQQIDFEEVVGYTYLGTELKASFAVIPIITEGIASVKIVLLEQGDNVGLIVPSNVANNYQKLLEDPTTINTVNTIDELIFEVFGFDANDPVLLDLVAEIYSDSNNKSPAYELVAEQEAEVKEEQEESEDEGDFSGLGLGGDASFGQRNERMFDDIDTDLGSLGEVEPNLESFSKFKKESEALILLENLVYNNTPAAIRELIKTKYIAKDNILVFEIDNKVIYETYQNLPQKAKSLLTELGELIRTNKTTQLVDSIAHKGKRLFFIAENINNNFWVVRDEALALLETNKKQKTVVPNSEEIIIIERTNVRAASRAKTPYKFEDRVAFVDKYQRIK